MDLDSRSTEDGAGSSWQPSRSGPSQPWPISWSSDEDETSAWRASSPSHPKAPRRILGVKGPGPSVRPQAIPRTPRRVMSPRQTRTLTCNRCLRGAAEGMRRTWMKTRGSGRYSSRGSSLNEAFQLVLWGKALGADCKGMAIDHGVFWGCESIVLYDIHEMPGLGLGLCTKYQGLVRGKNIMGHFRGRCCELTRPGSN